jgi:hypothetical protein
MEVNALIGLMLEWTMEVNAFCPCCYTCVEKDVPPTLFILYFPAPSFLSFCYHSEAVFIDSFIGLFIAIIIPLIIIPLIILHSSHLFAHY